MTARGQIALAELASVLAKLSPDQAAWAQIVRLLGLEGPLAQRAAAPRGGYDPDRAPGHRLSRLSSPPPAPRGQFETGEAAPDTTARGFLLAELQALTSRPTSRQTEAPAWLHDTAIAAIDAIEQPPRAPHEPDPLLAPLRARAILSAALATASAEGEPDIERIADARARLELLQSLPRRRVAVLRRGAQLLLDHSDSMAPYARDRLQLVAAIERVIGRSALNVLRFRGCPLRGVFRERERQPRDWSPPARHTVIAIVSDLGLGGQLLAADRAAKKDWLELAKRARSAGSPVVAFVPFGPARWDPALTRHITHVHWDRGTSAGVLRRALRFGHELR